MYDYNNIDSLSPRTAITPQTRDRWTRRILDRLPDLYASTQIRELLHACFCELARINQRLRSRRGHASAVRRCGVGVSRNRSHRSRFSAHVFNVYLRRRLYYVGIKIRVYCSLLRMLSS